MKKLLSLLMVLLLLAACGSKGGEEKGELYVFLPGEYISDDVINDFEEETGIKVYITTFDSNEMMYTKL
ncbi:MAG: ABC transporter substrate-binding protein, partial [Erysipelotrichaceae bacterium]|nr:ABC transporter substrate-binding protein [Erysipelotrichaceae bacterium]